MPTDTGKIWFGLNGDGTLHRFKSRPIKLYEDDGLCYYVLENKNYDELSYDYGIRCSSHEEQMFVALLTEMGITSFDYDDTICFEISGNIIQQ